MADKLPSDLIAAVAEGRAVLLLGAGASLGATDSNGLPIPDGTKLAGEIVKEFLGDEYKDYPFRSAYELACSSRDVQTVQKFIFDRLSAFHPTDFHLIVPTLPWAGILTTNYDLVIERAYSKVPSPIRKLIPNVRDGDGSTDRLDYRSVLYVKLHGCITRHYEAKPPMVVTTEQLIAFRQGREGQFKTFLEWAKTKPIIFAGYRFADQNLRTLFDEILKEGDSRPRHYIVDPGLLPREQDYWRDRRIIPLALRFDELLKELDDAIPPAKRALGALAASALHRTTFTRFITTPGGAESDELKHYLAALAYHVTPELEPSAGDPRQFYKGFNLEWYPIKADLDVRRALADQILREQVIPIPTAERPRITVLKGHAGSGKSTLLR
jgi:hypothetical protein